MSKSVFRDIKWVLLLDVLIELCSHPEVGSECRNKLQKLIDEVEEGSRRPCDS